MSTELIFTDNPGAIPATYVRGPSDEFRLSSVLARIDGSGASGPFLPCLSVYSQDGKLMARVPTDQTLQVGDTAVCTWAPFLRSQGQAAAASAELPSAYYNRVGPVVLGAGVHGGVFTGASFVTTDGTVWSAPNTQTLRASRGGLARFDVAGTFGANAPPYTGEFSIDVECLDAGSFPVDQLTGPAFYSPDLYDTAADTFEPAGTCTFNCDDAAFTPPYDFTMTITLSEAVTFTGFAMLGSMFGTKGLR